jgi:hypothetical protein
VSDAAPLLCEVLSAYGQVGHIAAVAALSLGPRTRSKAGFALAPAVFGQTYTMASQRVTPDRPVACLSHSRARSRGH